jgi:outer membrane receptor protein involved in Fe transport
MSGLTSRALIGAATVALALGGSTSAAQSPDSSRKTVPLAAVTITATRTERSTFETPQPVTVFDSTQLGESVPHGAADVFRSVAGLDASGVGPNQRRPEIRGLRGQRILLLSDGMRLNNARRQQDFGELPALAGDLPSIERVEVVRGPSSVLYGTDAIGGVVNVISRRVSRLPGAERLRGELTYRYGSAGNATTPSGTVTGRFGRLGLRATASYRDANDYQAPAGSFGDITLDERAVVNDSRVRDRSFSLAGEYDLGSGQGLFTRAELYGAENAGFGYVDPSSLGPNEPTIRIWYPDQDYTRYTLGYRAAALSTPFANRIALTGYTQRNTRHLAMDILVPISPTANVSTAAFNFTDLETVGGRLELAKVLGGGHVLTYGVDAFRDRSENTDSTITVVTGFGPPSTRASGAPTVPNATFRSAGAFAQLEVSPFGRLTTVFGGRVQETVAATRPTPGLTAPLLASRNRTGVWTANSLYRVTPDLNAVATVGRGFRAPNLIERFFEGLAPEGSGYQRANPALDPETSLNVDVGLRYRRGAWFAESFVFRNEIDDAIRTVATGDSVNRQPAFQNRNLDRLRVEGLEVTSGARGMAGVDLSASFTRLLGRNRSEPDSPIGDSYSSKLVGDVAYRRAGGGFTVGYTVRYQGEQKDVIIGGNPIGDVLPAFVVHSARASFGLTRRDALRTTLLVSVENIGDTLYAEFPNASFFRPEPGRSVALALIIGF